MKYLHRLLLAALGAAFFMAPAQAQNPGSVTNHAFVIGKGAGTTGYTSLLCGSAQLAVGQAAADPICRTITGDVTLSAAGAITLATVNSNVGSFGSATNCVTFTVNAKGLITAASQATCTPAVGSITGLGTGVATALGVNIGSAGAFITFNGALGTPSSGTLTNATGLPISTGVSGLGAGCATFLGTPSSANLRGCLTDEVGTGAAYFVGGALGTPASGTATNLTGLPISTGVSGLGTGVATALGVNVGSAGAFVTFNGALGTPSSGTLTNATGLPANGGLTGQVPIANGGTAQSTALAARGSSGLNIESTTTQGDSNGTMTATVRAWYHTALSAARTDTLPAANAVNAGAAITIYDPAGVVTGTNTVTVQRAGADTINGGTSFVALQAANAIAVCISDGTSKWGCSQWGGTGGGGGVTGITPGPGLVSSQTASCSQTAITTSGTLAAAECVNAQTGTSYAILDSDRAKLITATNAAAQAYTIAQAGAASSFQAGWFVDVANNSGNIAGVVTITPTTSTIDGGSTFVLRPGQRARIVSDGTNYQIASFSDNGGSFALFTNSLGADVALNNTANYFSGPAVAQGTSGTWWASGKITLLNTASAANFDCKLWDGTTVIAAASASSAGANFRQTISLVGSLASPAANIRIDCKDTTSTTGKMIFNQTGTSKDSTLTVMRIR